MKTPKMIALLFALFASSAFADQTAARVVCDDFRIDAGFTSDMHLAFLKVMNKDTVMITQLAKQNLAPSVSGSDRIYTFHETSWDKKAAELIVSASDLSSMIGGKVVVKYATWWEAGNRYGQSITQTCSVTAL